MGTGVIDRASRVRGEGERGTAQSALQPSCWPRTASWLLGFHSQGFAHEASSV